ncbi:MAG: hypothetical protein ABI831_06815 [Betaproteobacteria bacterium]
MIGLLGPLWGVIVYVVGALAVMAAIHGFDLSRQHIGRDEQKALDAPVMSICDSLPAPAGLFGPSKIKPADCAAQLRTGLAAIGANVQLGKDIQKLDDERRACSGKVDKLARISAQQAADKAGRQPAVDAKVAQIDVDKAELLVALGLPDPGGTCEQRLARRDALWNKVREQRLRDFPPTNGAPASSAVTIKQ